MAVFLSTLTACANGPAAEKLEQSLAADPKLQNQSRIFGQTKNQQISTGSQVELPADFPTQIPIYPNAKLAEIKPVQNSGDQISTRWQSGDPSNAIVSFYRSQFQNQSWQVLQQPQDDGVGAFTARYNNLLLKVTIQPKLVTQTVANQPKTQTQLLIEYTPNSVAINQPKLNANSTTVTQPDNRQLIGPVLPSVNVVQPLTSTNNTSKNQQFEDLDQVPPEWRQQIEDLGKLGVLSIKSQSSQGNSSSINNQAQKNKFVPNKIITRREYARWLIAANNAMYANNPAKTIRLASTATQSTFRDVLPNDPDFPAIQGLAEAGLISSSLSGDTTAVLFRPDAPLTRENLLMWKVPLDIRQALPVANLQAVKQTWGFQDTEKIDPKILRAILADFQNAEKSNIRRVFGYTTIFQPKKAVTRAEAGAALSYFGVQSEGMSTTQALKLKGE